jgi:hypothetical protein
MSEPCPQSGTFRKSDITPSVNVWNVTFEQYTPIITPGSRQDVQAGRNAFPVWHQVSEYGIMKWRVKTVYMLPSDGTVPKAFTGSDLSEHVSVVVAFDKNGKSRSLPVGFLPPGGLEMLRKQAASWSDSSPYAQALDRSLKNWSPTNYEINILGTVWLR